MCHRNGGNQLLSMIPGRTTKLQWRRQDLLRGETQNYTKIIYRKQNDTKQYSEQMRLQDATAQSRCQTLCSSKVN